MRTGRAFLGIMAGFTAGTVLGMVLAKQGPGKRRNIARRGEDLANALNAKIDARFDELLRSSKGRVENTGNDPRRGGVSGGEN